jgi:hypothetical protein
LTRDEAYRLIDQAPRGTTFYRLIISPDPKREDTDQDLILRQITEQTLSALATRRGAPIQYVGAIHADHAAHRHVHVIALVKGRLTRKDFQFLRQQATEASVMQRRELDAARGLIRGKEEAVSQHGSSQSQLSSSGGYTADSLFSCPICGQVNCLKHGGGLGIG